MQGVNPCQQVGFTVNDPGCRLAKTVQKLSGSVANNSSYTIHKPTAKRMAISKKQETERSLLLGWRVALR